MLRRSQRLRRYGTAKLRLLTVSRTMLSPFTCPQAAGDAEVADAGRAEAAVAEQPGTSAQGLPASDGTESALKKVRTSPCLRKAGCLVALQALRLLCGAQRKKGALTVVPERVEAQVSGIMSTSEFAGLELSAPTQAAVEKQGFKLMTEVQARTIPHLLAGRDVLGAAKTGAPAAEAFVARLSPMHIKAMQQHSCSERALA